MVHEQLPIDDWLEKYQNKFDVIITDPPYPFNEQNGTNRYKDMYQKFTWKQLSEVYQKLYDRLNSGGRVYYFCNRDGIIPTIDIIKNIGYDFLNLLVWDKKAFGGGYHYRNQLEYIVYASKGRPRVEVKGISNIFSYKRPLKSDNHPEIDYWPAGKASAKPYQIWRDILLHGVLDEEVVADPFSGTNPLRAACLLDKDVAEKKLKIYTNSYLT